MNTEIRNKEGGYSLLDILIVVGIAAALTQLAFAETRDRAIRNVADATKTALHDRVKADLQTDYVDNAGTFVGASLDRVYRNGIGKPFMIVSGSASATESRSRPTSNRRKWPLLRLWPSATAPV